MATASTIDIGANGGTITWSATSDPANPKISITGGTWATASGNKVTVGENTSTSSRRVDISVEATTTADTNYNGTATETSGYTIQQEGATPPPVYHVSVAIQDGSWNFYGELQPQNNASVFGTVTSSKGESAEFNYSYRSGYRGDLTYAGAGGFTISSTDSNAFSVDYSINLGETMGAFPTSCRVNLYYQSSESGRSSSIDTGGFDSGSIDLWGLVKDYPDKDDFTVYMWLEIELL